MERKELESLFVYQLIELAEDEGITVSKYWKKDKIIDEILGYEEQEEVVEESEEVIEEPQMSVRVKRIKELNRS